MNLCSIASGSSGNCIYVGTDNTHIMVDAGITKKRIDQGLSGLGIKTEEISGILVTHEHSDHIKGLGVLSRKYEIPIYGTRGTIEAIKGISTLGEIPDGLFQVIEADNNFAIGDLEIEPFAISHDAAEPVAYRVNSGGKSAGIVTDLGVYTEEIVKKLRGLNVLLLEANHDIRMLEIGGYPYYLKRRIAGDRGHLSNELSGRLLCEILHDKLKQVVLGHLSKENNYAELAYETVKLEITLGDNPYKGDEIPIQVARRDEVSEMIAV